MLLQKEKQSIEEIGKKDKKIYERRKVSLSNIYDLLFPQKSRKYFRTNAKEHIGEVSSVKVSFCTSFRGRIKKGSLAVETALVLPLFFLGMVTLISFMDIYKLQTEHLTALCTKAKHHKIQSNCCDQQFRFNIIHKRFHKPSPPCSFVLFYELLRNLFHRFFKIASRFAHIFSIYYYL